MWNSKSGQMFVRLLANTVKELVRIGGQVVRLVGRSLFVLAIDTVNLSLIYCAEGLFFKYSFVKASLQVLCRSKQFTFNTSVCLIKLL